MLSEPVKIGTVTLYNCDCMELLHKTSDKYYDVAIVDIPYGLGGKWISTGKGGFTLKPEEVEEMNKWDFLPPDEYFIELERVAKNRIMWGGNYVFGKLGACRGPIIWDKGQHGFTLADGELAWSSFDKPMRICPSGKSIRSADKKNVQGRRHGTQKPAYMYRWLLERYAKPGQKILDTHLGSGTHAMACLEMGFELDACEISEKYFNEAIKRIREYLSSHEKIFTDSPKVKLAEEGIF
jgi:site-specific DNA-methyltransferase (adenine-specific)